MAPNLLEFIAAIASGLDDHKGIDGRLHGNIMMNCDYLRCK
jgi:hypothetical protein